MLSSNIEHVIGSVLPYQGTGDEQDKLLASTVLNGGVMAKHVSGGLQHLLPALAWHTCWRLTLADATTTLTGLLAHSWSFDKDSQPSANMSTTL